MRSPTALRERMMNCTAMYTRLISRSYSTSTSSPQPPSSEKYVAVGQRLLRVSGKSTAKVIKADTNVFVPRVVVYDGVSHLGHIGNFLIFFCVCVCGFIDVRSSVIWRLLLFMPIISKAVSSVY